MKLFRKILFWVYFSIASLALVAVIIYLTTRYRRFKNEAKYESELSSFNSYFLSRSRQDSTFASLFNTNSESAISFLNRSNNFLNDIKYETKSIQINKEEIDLLEGLYKKWPKRYQDIAKENILAIYVVDTAYFNGLTHIIPAKNDRFIVFLNSNLFTQTPNAWITNQCTKVLKEDNKSRIKFQLFPESENTPIRTVEHVLLHEFSHIISFLTQIAPLPNGSFANKSGYYPIIESSFEGGIIEYDKLKPEFNKFEILSGNECNSCKTLDFAEFKALNKALTMSSFPSPYSTRNSSELVAESLTYYIHQYYQNYNFFVVFDKSDTVYFAQKIDTSYLSNILK